MTEYRATTRWTRTSSEFTYDTYNRDHEVTFGSGHVVPWSSAPEFKGNADRVNPEEAFVASLASCHMLWFLGLAARRGFRVDRYADAAVGVMARNETGKLAMTLVTLRPSVQFSGDVRPTRADIDALHHAAHDACFIASSVKTDVRCEPRP